MGSSDPTNLPEPFEVLTMTDVVGAQYREALACGLLKDKKFEVGFRTF